MRLLNTTYCKVVAIPQLESMASRTHLKSSWDVDFRNKKNYNGLDTKRNGSSDLTHHLSGFVGSKVWLGKDEAKFIAKLPRV